MQLFKIISKSIKVIRNEGTAGLLKVAKSKMKRFAPWMNKDLSVNAHIRSELRNSDLLSTLFIQSSTPRLNIVTDSLTKESFFGGVATSVLLSTLFAKKFNHTLRLISRSTLSKPHAYFQFLKMVGISPPEKVEFYSDHLREEGKNHFKLETSSNDIYIATSWWSSKAIQSANLKPYYFYLLQEAEPQFYNHGDLQLFCKNTLEDPKARYIVNTKLLHDYLIHHDYEQVKKHSTSFEPAFPLFSPSETSFKKKNKFRFFFYARPNHPRNLFLHGLQFLDTAISTGILSPDEWEFIFAGSDALPKIEFSAGVKPKNHGNMTWSEYAQLAGTVDLCFSLMYTPHPSYPPLDFAASGSVVLTNTCAGKESLPYSKNIICAEPTMPAMLEGFKTAVHLAKDPLQREQHFKENQISRDWESSFRETLEYMSKVIHKNG